LRDVKLAARARESAKEASLGSSIDALGRPDGAVGAFGPGPATIGVEVTFERLADELGMRIDHLAAAGLGAMRGCVPSWLAPSDPSWDQLEEQLRASLRTELASFRAGLLPGELPTVDAFLVDLAEEMGDLDALIAGHRFAQTSLWGAWFDLVERVNAPGPTKQELLARGSRYFLRYAELVGRYLAEAYRRGMERRSGLAVQIVAGPAGHSSEDNPFADAFLGFDFGRYHLGAIVWGEAPERTARELAARLDRVVQVRARGSTSWVCLSGHDALSQHGLRELEAFEPESGVRLAFGLEGFGEEGLRVSFRQALRARKFAGSGAVTRYEDVAVEALALQAEDDVRAFVSHELRGIDDDSAASGRLRETLAAYFSSHLNAASAAAQLGVHHQTVANRLRTIEDRLGRPLMARTLELALALRLRERMPGRDGTAPPGPGSQRVRAEGRRVRPI